MIETEALGKADAIKINKGAIVVKTIHGLKYYTGAHPEMRTLLQKNRRPSEFGNKVWATSLVLMNHLKSESSTLNRLRVLEIGCGWGLLGLYLAKAHSCQVTCSDVDPQVLPIVELHADLNKVKVETACLGFSDLSENFLKNFDLIIGAEVCYSDEIAKEICELIARAFKAGVSRIVIGDPGRPGFDDCLNLCKDKFKTTLTQGPGTVNGKITHILNVSAN